MAALIAMDDGRVVQLGSILAAHGANHVKNEVNSEVVAESVSQHFMRTDVKDCEQIADAALVKDVLVIRISFDITFISTPSASLPPLRK